MTDQPHNALVTGSTSGIGRGIVTRFAEAGMNVVLNGFGDPGEIERLRASLESEFGIRALYSPADLTQPSDIAGMVALAQDELGTIDILVNNAGVQHVAPIEDFPPEKWHLIIELNLSAAFFTMKAFLPDMKARGFGRIINMASAHALVASPFKAAYVAAKHGLAGLTKVAALEAAEHGVTVNAICPGYVKTPLVERQIPDTAKARGLTEEEVVRQVILEAQPTKTFVETDEISALALFLCSPEAASITGSLISIDGGWVAQ